MRVLGWIEDLSRDLEAIGADSPPAPRWNQDWFPRLDAAAAYAIVRTTRPRRIVEVGSGHSTRFLARAVADGRLATQITCIDPAPRASIAQLPITHLAAPVQQAPIALFQALAPGDILFIDSSHQVKPGGDVDFLFRVLPILASGVRVHFHDVFPPGDILFIDSSHQMKPGSDVDWLIARVLPILQAGVRVHFHDIFLPDDYPGEWAWRRYNEQPAVKNLMTSGYALEFSSHQARRQGLNGVLARLPLMPGAHESSFWLRKR
jgi:hypothetical protein